MLNEMQPIDAINYVVKDLGVHGAMDCLDKEL
jgi:hypothetical protein